MKPGIYYYLYYNSSYIIIETLKVENNSFNHWNNDNLCVSQLKIVDKIVSLYDNTNFIVTKKYEDFTSNDVLYSSLEEILEKETIRGKVKKIILDRLFLNA